MKTIAIIPESNSYWNVLKDLSDEVKLDLFSERLIGCTSVIYRLVMVTENLKDFKNISNIRLENWIRR